MVMSYDGRGVVNIISASATLQSFIYFLKYRINLAVDLEVGLSHLWLMRSRDMVQQMSPFGGAGEIAQWLRVLIALPDNSSLGAPTPMSSGS